MKKILATILLCSYSYALFLDYNFNQYDLEVLGKFDVEDSFATNYKFQKLYKTMINHNANMYATMFNDASLFLPKVKKTLKESQIPENFIYLMMAESNLNTDAFSRVKAVGLWQFMSATGKKYGLKQNFYVDERMDIVKSTKAASKYLTSLYKRFDKWYLAAIAYNCGEGRVTEAITRATLDSVCGQRDEHCKNNREVREFRRTIKKYQKGFVGFGKLRPIYNYVKKLNIKLTLNDLLVVQNNIERQYLPRESRKYIMKILSLALMGNRNFTTDDSYTLNQGIISPIVKVDVSGGTHIRDVAKLIGVKHSELSNLNKHLKHDITNPYETTTNIYIPYSRLSRFNGNRELLKETAYSVYTVKSGDSLRRIGNLYGISFELIKKFNNIKSNIIRVDQKILIPLPKGAQVEENYVVQTGDTLGQIAQKYKISLNKLMQDNKLSSSTIRVGEKIVIYR
jgi:membrane-bound lytic murein transglycosylase D